MKQITQHDQKIIPAKFRNLLVGKPIITRSHPNLIWPGLAYAIPHDLNAAKGSHAVWRRLTSLVLYGILAAAAVMKSGPASGQAPYVANYFTEVNGLLDNRTSDLLIDHRGFCWISHTAGISRYDGHNFDTYKLPPAFVMPDNDLKIAETSDGRLIACNKLAIGAFTFEPAHPFRLLAAFPSPNHVYDAEASGTAVWLATDRGLWKYEAATGLRALYGIKEVIFRVLTDHVRFTYAFGEHNTYIIENNFLIKKLPLATIEREVGGNTFDNKQGVWHLYGNKVYYLQRGAICDSQKVPVDKERGNNTCLFLSPYNGRLYYT